MKSKYLKLLEKGNVPPNFYCSQEYFEKSGIEEYEVKGYICWFQDSWAIVPPISLEGKLGSPEWLERVWSDFEHWTMVGMTTFDFLDYEFIYDPKSFLDMKGKDWQVFRKNVRKFPARYPNPTNYFQTFLQEKWWFKKIIDTFSTWLVRKGDETFQDVETTIHFLLHGKNRKILLDENTQQILGINVWDSNYKYINFRYSFYVDIPFLSEYLRYLFYTDPEIQSQGKLVNDGGVVGNEGLKDFKMKLNPLYVREVRSWRKIKEEIGGTDE